MCYDENDGYFDHVPPFLPPHWRDAQTGKVSAGIDTSVEFVSLPQEKEIRQRENEIGRGGLAGPIGLGFRVPLVIASPWSRGGYVCSQVFDHTSILQLLESVLSHKTGRPIRETNISAWRRTVCGDLSSAFRPYNGEKISLPPPVERKPFFASISRAQFRPVPEDYQKLSPQQIVETRSKPRSAAWLPRQENGTRPACALPYELTADGRLSADKETFAIRLGAGNQLFDRRAAGAPFRVYAPAKIRSANGPFEIGRSWNYAVRAGDSLSDTFALDSFEDGIYHLQVTGPNGFYREFRGSGKDPELELAFHPDVARNSLVAVLRLTNHDPHHPLIVVASDLSYGTSPYTVKLSPSEIKNLMLDLSGHHGWYDWLIRVEGAGDFEQRYAGRLENGLDGRSDPLMA